MEKGLDSSTIVNHLWSLKKYFFFLETFQIEKASSALCGVIRTIERGLRKKREKKRKMTRETKVLELEKIWPPGGIKELQSIVKRYIRFQS